ncbi:hypothetical protein PI124_g3831 [Phytophthora idaei]|nr:hypothetical protein PI124_g3831 [Phytophthora idaei]
MKRAPTTTDLPLLIHHVLAIYGKLPLAVSNSDQLPNQLISAVVRLVDEQLDQAHNCTRKERGILVWLHRGRSRLRLEERDG